MPAIQTLFHGISDVCEKCDSPLGGNGSNLPVRDGRKRYLCQPCTELRQALKTLIHDKGGITWAEQQVEMLVGMEQHPMLAPDDCDTYFRKIRDEIYQSRVSLQHLIREAEIEQPWD